jgi:hypothetical protein
LASLTSQGIFDELGNGQLRLNSIDRVLSPVLKKIKVRVSMRAHSQSSSYQDPSQAGQQSSGAFKMVQDRDYAISKAKTVLPSVADWKLRHVYDLL